MELRLTKGGETRTATVPDNTNLEKLAAAGYQVEQLPDASKPPPSPARKNDDIGVVGSFFQGAADPALGALQLGSHATGIGKEWLDKKLTEREADLERRGIGEHSWARFGGDALSPINFMPGGILARAGMRGLPLALSAGALGGVTNPTAGGEDYWTSKLEQAGLGAVAGGALHLGGGWARSRRIPTVDETRSEARRFQQQGDDIRARRAAQGFTGADLDTSRSLRASDRASRLGIAAARAEHAQGLSRRTFPPPTTAPTQPPQTLAALLSLAGNKIGVGVEAVVNLMRHARGIGITNPQQAERARQILQDTGLTFEKGAWWFRDATGEYMPVTAGIAGHETGKLGTDPLEASAGPDALR